MITPCDGEAGASVQVARRSGVRAGAPRERAILGIGAALAVAVPIALAAHVRSRCADELGTKLTALAGMPSRITTVDAGLTGTVRLADVAIGDLFAARAIEARVALPSLLAGRLTADEVFVEAPRLRATVTGGKVDLIEVMRRIAGRRSGTGTGTGTATGMRSVRRIVVTDGDLVVAIAGVGTVSASEVEFHPQAGGVRVLTGAVKVDAAARGVTARAGFARSAADIALPAVRLERLVATGGTATGHGPGGPALAISGATLTFGAHAGPLDHPAIATDLAASSAVATVRGDLDDAGVPRPIQVAVARDAIAVAVDHAPLAAAAPWLPAGVRVDGARFTGSIDAARAGSGLAIAARGELAGVVVQSAAIADHPVAFDGGGDLTLAWRPSGLDADAHLTTGKAQVGLTAHLDRGATGWDHGEVAVTVPPTPCLDVLDSIPRGLRGATAGLTVEGTAQARIAITVNGTVAAAQRGADGSMTRGAPAEAVAIDANVDVGGCKVVAEAPAGDPARLATTRDHHYPDGSHASVGPGSDGWTVLADLPGYVPGAFVAAEDARFWDHRGFDAEQIARSLEVDLREHRIARGGSTISQQLVKNVFLGPERTFARKLEEAILTWRLEATTTKRTILEQYLNLIELGPGVFGIDAAARHWFGKAARHLSTAEAAFLAALTPEPRSMTARIVAQGGLDRRSRERVDVVLRAMKRAGVIDSDRYATARDADLDFRSAAVAGR